MADDMRVTTGNERIEDQMVKPNHRLKAMGLKGGGRGEGVSVRLNRDEICVPGSELKHGKCYS